MTAQMWFIVKLLLRLTKYCRDTMYRMRNVMLLYHLWKIIIIAYYKNVAK